MANHSGYTDSELMKMQQDAVRRVKEMQRRTQAYAQQSMHPAPQQSGSGSRVRFQPKTSGHTRQRDAHSGPERGRQSSGNAARRGQEAKAEEGIINPGRAINRLLSGIQFDSDTIIILGLAWLLFKNGGSYKLILALLYILL